MSHRTKENIQSMNFNNLPQDIVAKALSYAVTSTRDLAHLRLVSKEFKIQILPYVLQNLNGLSCNYGRTNFLTELLECVDDDHTGELWKKFQRRINREGFSIQSILLVKESYHPFSKTCCSIEDNDKISQLCDDLVHARSVEELTQFANIAKKKGLFSPLIRTACNEVESVNISQPSTRLSCLTSSNDADEYDRTHCAIITLTLPRNAACIERINSTFMHFQSTALFQEALAPFLLRNEDLKATFGGQIIKESATCTTVRVPMYLRSCSDTFWDLNQIAVSELLYVNQLFDKYNARTSLLEGIVVVDGVLHSCECDRFTNDIRMVSNLKIQGGILESHEMSGLHQIATDVPIVINTCKGGVSTITNDLHQQISRKEFPTFYSSLERLFSHILPFMEVAYNDEKKHSSLSNAQSIDSFSDEWFDDFPPLVQEENCYSLKGKQIHLRMQLVDITLGPEESCTLSGTIGNASNSVNVVATVIFIPHRGEGLVGGDVVFNRSFYQDEEHRIQCASSMRCMPQALMDVISRGQHPLGRVGLVEGRVIVYPKHCHVHECTELKNRFQRRNGLEVGGSVERQNGSPKRQKKIDEEHLNQSGKMVIFHLINPEF